MARKSRDDHLRAADADRQQVASVVEHAVGEGRLTLEEADERLRQVWAARTFGELRAVVADLPVAQPAAVGAGWAARRGNLPVPLAAVLDRRSVGRRERRLRRLRVSVSSWASTGVLLTGVWAVTGEGDFWPAYPIGIWGAVIAARAIRIAGDR